MIMYGVYNVDTLEKLIQMVHKMNTKSVWFERLYAGHVLYNILLLINCYLGNSTTKCHSRSMSDNRDLTETFHQNISSYYKVIASVF